MNLTEVLAQGTPRLMAVDEWHYEGEPTGLRVAALADHTDTHRATVIVEPNTQMILAMELFTEQGTYAWRELEFELPVDGQIITAQEALVLLSKVMFDPSSPQQLDNDTT